MHYDNYNLHWVALRKESVDRNFYNFARQVCLTCVALRKESVDRNTTALAVLSMYSVALRKESVDRNQRIAKPFREQFKSLSARRAWIEIRTRSQPSKPNAVALRKESVDRNCWSFCRVPSLFFVALRKESVDRNSF